MYKAMEDMRNESLQEGIKQGLTEGMKTVAFRMLDAGKYALDEIAGITGLTLDEVANLRTKQNA